MSTQIAQTTDASKDPKDAVQEALAQVNALTLSDMTSKLKAYPSMDMTDILAHTLKTYPTLRKVFRDSALQSLKSVSDSANAPNPPADPRDNYQIPSDAKVIRPLDAAVMRAIQMDSTANGATSDLSTVIQQLNERVACSEIIWQLGSTAVLGLDSQLVIKLENGIDVDHIPMIDHLKQHAPQLPIPAIHGILQQADSRRSFIFMSRAPGVPLSSIWKSMNGEQKASIKDQLNTIVAKFRSIPAPPSEDPRAVLGGGNPRRCKDTRRDICIADGPISNEAEFNAFISSRPRRTITGQITMIRSYLTTDHNVVMTHGDLHPRNIMVSITPGNPDVITITAILGWEMCGWYPEYWEYVKALNTVTPRDGFGDWYAYLPPNIGVWPKEHAVDTMLSRWHG
ncbi:hypothetical protein BJX63DRAFT_160900 [Aspergillus granulosus]|uniref:Aminoglycoside phosphotransferase domain-containing protein n=1 Tax=Aspergillus granulosus TaxID=176169 RepID=A0ABR4HJE9_9EURO